MKREKICVFCQNIINLDKEKYVLLGTYNGLKVMDESYFHFQCFQQWYNARVVEKTKNTIKNATQKVAGMLGGLRKMAVGNSGESKEVFDMSAEIPNMDKEVNIF